MNFPFSLKKDCEFDIVGFGTNAVDFLIEVPRYPEFNSKIALSAYTQAPGGEVASTLVGLSRLGISTSYVGRFGDDDAGQLGHASLEREGVSTRYAEFVPETPNQVAFIIVDEQTGERTVIWHRDQRLGYQANEAPLDAASIGKILHLTPHDLAACIEMATHARSAGTIVSADVDKLIDGMDDLLTTVDILLMSDEFPAQLVGISDHRQALREIYSRYGNAVVGVTKGRSGSLILCNGEFVENDGFETPGGCRDTTGAGDAFRSGFLAGVIHGKSVEAASVAANAVATLKCRAVGARTSLPAIAELNAFLQKNVDTNVGDVLYF